MNILTLLMHAGSILKAVRTMESIVAGCIKDKRAPTTEDDKALISACEDLLVSGIIEIPGLPSDQIKTALDQVKAVL